MRREKGWLYLPVEVKVRELDAKLLLAYYAVKEGYRVIIGEHKMVELASTIYPKGIFFSKGYPRGFRKRVITNAINSGHKVVELDEEGLLISNPNQYLSSRMANELMGVVSQEYCWGNFQKQVITSANPKSENKCYIVGNPRFDLLAPKYNIIYETDAQKIRNIYDKFILINTRFSIYNSLNGITNQNNHYMSTYFKKLYDSFIEMIKRVCQKYPDINFVVRPHPGENVETYRNALSNYKNVYVVHEGNIISWIKAATVVLHNGCTSSIEAFLLEKPIISYMPIPTETYDVDLPNQMGMKANNIEAVQKFLNNMICNDDLFLREYNEHRKQQKKVLSDFYRLPEKQFAHESILSLLHPISEPLVKNTSSIPQKNLYLKENKYVKYYFPSLNHKEIQDFFTRIDAIENKTSNISIKWLGRNLFELQRKKV